jgi:arogenate dehydrogenase (NADP+)
MIRIGIVGLGLIGGSLGLDLRRLGYEVLGVSRQLKTCERALELGVVDQASVDLSLLARADLIFVCTPLGAIASTVEQLLPYLATEAILTDVGSVKTAIIEQVTPLWHNFVGGHPMAGTAESGIEAALLGLFAGNPYVLTPVAATPPDAVQVVEEVVRSLTERVYFCRPEDHDRAVAWISHLPVMVSANLITACLAETDPVVLQLAQQLASSGFRDTTRVGGGNPELGLMMARYNRDSLLRSLISYRQNLDQLIAEIEQSDWQSLENKLHSTQADRRLFFPTVD